MRMEVTCFSTAGQADDETVGDGRVGAALRHEAEHVPLARGEGLEARPAGPGEDLGDDLGVDHGAAAGHAAEGVEELVHVGHAVLEHVAEAAHVAGEELAGVPLLDVLRQDQHGQPRVQAAQVHRGPQALVGVRRGHPDVGDQHVGQRRRTGPRAATTSSAVV